MTFFYENCVEHFKLSNWWNSSWNPITVSICLGSISSMGIGQSVCTKNTIQNNNSKQQMFHYYNQPFPYAHRSSCCSWKLIMIPRSIQNKLEHIHFGQKVFKNQMCSDEVAVGISPPCFSFILFEFKLFHVTSCNFIN